MVILAYKFNPKASIGPFSLKYEKGTCNPRRLADAAQHADVSKGHGRSEGGAKLNFAPPCDQQGPAKPHLGSLGRLLVSVAPI